MGQTISSKFGHGGARANAGGARENSGGFRPGAGRPWKAPDTVVIIPSVPRWCVYQTHPQAERLAAEDLTRSGYQGYAPMIAVRKRDVVIRSLFHKVRVARFPGYGFVKLSPGESWLPILDASGVSRVLRGLDGRPARVPTGEIERHMLDDERLCDLERETMPAFKVGDRVTILEGALSSFEGSVLKDDGLATLVEVQMFGRPMPVWCDRASVEAV